MSEDKNKTPLYYPRKMRTGWCVAHEVTAAGVTIERYGIHCQTYAEALRGSIQNVAWTKCRTKYVKPLVHR